MRSLGGGNWEEEAAGGFEPGEDKATPGKESWICNNSATRTQ